MGSGQRSFILEVAMEVLLRRNDEWMHNLVSEAKCGGHITEFEVLWRDTTMLLRFATVLGNKSWCPSHIIAGNLQSEITGYCLS